MKKQKCWPKKNIAFFISRVTELVNEKSKPHCSFIFLFSKSLICWVAKHSNGPKILVCSVNYKVSDFLTSWIYQKFRSIWQVPEFPTSWLPEWTRNFCQFSKSPSCWLPDFLKRPEISVHLASRWVPDFPTSRMDKKFLSIQQVAELLTSRLPE